MHLLSILACIFAFFFFECYGAYRDLHSFPTRRSSDLSYANFAELEQGATVRLMKAGIGALCMSQGLKPPPQRMWRDRKSTRLNSSHRCISYAVFCLKKKKQSAPPTATQHCPTKCCCIR